MVSFEENIKVWQDIAAGTRGGAAAAATAMAKYIAERTAKDTLTRSSHGSGAWHRTRPGEPPARSTGALARGMFYKPSYGTGGKASAWVGNRVEYSRIMEYGCTIEPVGKKFLQWRDSGGAWYHVFLESKPHPFLEPTVDESVDDGSLRDHAIKAFEPYDP